MRASDAFASKATGFALGLEFARSVALFVALGLEFARSVALFVALGFELARAIAIVLALALALFVSRSLVSSRAGWFGFELATHRWMATGFVLAHFHP